MLGHQSRCDTKQDLDPEFRNKESVGFLGMERFRKQTGDSESSNARLYFTNINSLHPEGNAAVPHASLLKSRGPISAPFGEMLGTGRTKYCLCGGGGGLPAKILRSCKYTCCECVNKCIC